VWIKMSDFPQPERFEEEREADKSKVFPMRLNEREREIARKLMGLFNVKSPVTAIKQGAEVGLNVLHSTLGVDLMKRLFSKERLKLEDYDIEKTKIFRESNTNKPIL